jgi:hypothetical protein
VTTATKAKAKRPTKVDRLWAQGQWVLAEIEGQKVPYFAMPNAKLQSELTAELEKKIKAKLKADDFELLHATRREHPFHSELLREGVDALADLSSSDHRAYSTEARAETARQDLLGLIEDTKNYTHPFTEYDIEKLVERGRKEAVRAWAHAIGLYREYFRDPSGTKALTLSEHSIRLMAHRYQTNCRSQYSLRKDRKSSCPSETASSISM